MRDHCGRDGGMAPDCMRPVSLIRSAVWCLAITIALSTFIAVPAVGKPLSRSEFDALAKQCAAGVSAEVLESVAAKESHFDPLALHDNTRKITRTAADAKAAAGLARSWIAAGDSVDIGLMQINAPNLAPLGLTVAEALDPCLSLAAGAAVLRDAYRKSASQADQQAALLIMLSRYNTGRPLAGLVNGYVEDVIAYRPAAASPRTEPAVEAEVVTPSLPAWDMWVNASYAQTHGAAWLVNLSTAPSVPKATPPKGTPSQKPQ